MPNASSTSPEPARGVTHKIDNPFVDPRFLSALHRCDCLDGTRGWQAHEINVSDFPGAWAPAWIKQHSHGEFVFDHIWARAAHQAGMRWYPKLLIAAPLSPVTGPRLIAEHQAGRIGLARHLVETTESLELSSCGINFCSELDRQALSASAAEHGWLARHDWQFHWHNRGWKDFDEFLAALRSKPRKNIRRERRMAHADGWRYRWVDGEHVDESELALAQRCYATTFALYGNLAYLNLAFFRAMAQEFGGDFLLCIASQNGHDLACGIFWKSRTRLYGRYWGALTETRDVHFETCYYQGIEYCIQHGLEAFEPGAQGEHKIRRGFLPIKTHSFHYIRHPGLRAAIADWLQHERRALADYRAELEALNPYRDRP